MENCEPPDGNLIPDRISALTDDDLIRIMRRCSDDLERLLLTQSEAARHLGVSKQAIFAAVRSGRLVPVAKGLFLLPDVEARRGSSGKGTWKMKHGQD